jgi:hypothetical protein
MRVTILFILLVASGALWAQSETPGQLISDPKFHATAPRLTSNHLRQPVLSWAERNEKNEVVGFYFAVSSDGGTTFGARKSVSMTTGVSGHAEGMPKIAFKSDGTVVAAYEARRPTPESRFAGNIYYRLSKDGGQSWSALAFVHRDTTPGKSRSFMDLQTLPNGEVGMSWLGERGPDEDSGRPLRFAMTTPGAGFGPEITAKEGACQCCRTNLFADKQGRLHIFFRDILPGGIRDIGHVVSLDGGRSFGAYRVLHSDQWRIDGCPHTGPCTAQLDTTLFTAWYTGAEHAPGIKVSAGSGRLLTSVSGSAVQHPQIVATGTALVLAWEQIQESDNQSAIVLRFLDPADGKEKTETIAVESTENAVLPALLPLQNGVLLAYEAGPEKKRQVRWKKVGGIDGK